MKSNAGAIEQIESIANTPSLAPQGPLAGSGYVPPVARGQAFSGSNRSPQVPGLSDGNPDVTTLRAHLLRSASDFVEIWQSIETLRADCSAVDDVLLDPIHFLATTSRDRRASCSVACWSGSRLVGLLFATQHLAWGASTGYALGGDCSGRGLLLCRPEHEVKVVEAAVGSLFKEGIHSLHLRMAPRTEALPRFGALTAKYLDSPIPGDRMKLGGSFEEFLQGLGKHTRRNVRYYTRRATESGIQFDPHLSEAEFLRERTRLNGVTSFPTKSAYMAEDDRLLALHNGGERMGLRASDGQVIALLCGFTRRGRFHVLTQWNDITYSKLSLSMVLRGCMIEHLIASGHEELQFMGGLSLGLGRFCAPHLYRSITVDRGHGVMKSVKRIMANYCLKRERAGKPLSSTVKTMSGGFLDDSLLGQRITLNSAGATAHLGLASEDNH